MRLSYHILTILFIAGAVLFQTACGSKQHLTTNNEHFCLSDSMKKKVVIDTVKLVQLKEELKLTAKVSFDEDKVVPIFAIVGGTVTDVEVELGDYVKKGQVLAVIKSSRLVEYTQQLITAQANLLVAQKNLNVKEELFQDGLASKSDVSLAEKEVQNNEAELNRIKEINKLYNVNGQSDYIIRSPMDGFVVEKKIARDMQIREDRNESIFTISSLSDVWIMADVYQTDISKVKVGDPAYIATISYPDKIYKAAIDKIFNVIDSQLPALKVRLRLQNLDFALKPGMFCSVKLHFDRPEQKVAVPASSIIFDKNKYYTIVYRGNCSLETREVNIFSTIGQTSYIQLGLQPNELILSKYHLMVYDALND